MTLAKWLIDEMNKRDWNQSELARAAGIKRQTLNFILTGRSRTPDLDTLKKLAHALNVPLEEVYRASGALPAASFKDKLIRRIEDILNGMTDEELEQAERVVRAIAGDKPKKNKRNIERMSSPAGNG